MSLATADGPLSANPADSNYEIEGPAHKIFWHPHTRRLRAELGGRDGDRYARGAPAVRDGHPRAPVRPARRRAAGAARAERADELLPVQGHRELSHRACRRRRREGRALGLRRAERGDAVARGLRRRVRGALRPLARRGGRGARAPARPVPPRRHPPLEPDGPRDRSRRGAHRRVERAADRVRDRLRRPLLPAAGRRAGRASAEREGHRLPVQGHDHLLVRPGRRGRRRGRTTRRCRSRCAWPATCPSTPRASRSRES